VSEVRVLIENRTTNSHYIHV